MVVGGFGRTNGDGMKIMFIGDIYGRPGRDALARALPDLKQLHGPDFVIANAENSAGGKGVTRDVADDLFALGIDCLTGGNHSFHQKDADQIFAADHRLLRPGNMPPGTPGEGWGIFQRPQGHPVAVLNLCGRTFMANYDDPFRAADALLERVSRRTPLIFVDFHAEATSEKVAMGWYLNGRVTAVVGTHTHIQTADEAVLNRETAFLTDAGMTGPYESVIGAPIQAVLESMTTLRPRRFGVAPARDVRVCGVVVEADSTSGRARRIDRFCIRLGNLEG